ncbi:hypothetical protein BV372_09335 [Nostoc sp. T09]|uniref:DUF2752 domain-containing protein n=1 Tax=Nostoc sp. T09 TaxID=1932621 RepID=UPI000A39FC56|nr:DUF2752 domain-containing protein [Nostoc sp. T09]OUL35915.1 hypothetical protein BV372_09335 [Nostoc sp. T09]
MNIIYRRSSSVSTKTLKVAALSGIIVLAAIILYFFNPSNSPVYPPSPFRSLTGLYCPGCGTLRALHQLLHGHILKAFELNPLMMLAMPYLVYSYVCYSAPIIIGAKIPQIFIKPAWIWLVLKIILGYWVLRNIPFAPFSWLAP